VIAVFFIPMFFYVLETMSEKSGGKKTPGSTGTPPPDIGPPAGGPKVTPLARREDD
jgi:multidrug efflux pump